MTSFCFSKAGSKHRPQEANKKHPVAKVRCADQKSEGIPPNRFALAFRKIFGLFTFGLPGASLIQPLFLLGVG